MIENNLLIKNLYVSISQKKIVKGASLEIKKGEVHALMGPNGSGKSTLSFAVMGHPKYLVDSGDILFNGQSIKEMPSENRARLGIFLSFQYPTEIPGVRYSNFLRLALNANRKSQGQEPISVLEFSKLLKQELKKLGMDESFSTRYLNEGFSGGEKKRSEILQLAVLKPKIAILDETDSGLDIDALKVVSNGINTLKNPDNGILLITHYNRILRYIQPDKVHILVKGRIIRSGGHELARELDEKGYEWANEDEN